MLDGNEAALAAALAACAVSALVFALVYPYFSGGPRRESCACAGSRRASGPNAGQAARDMAAKPPQAGCRDAEGAGEPPEGLGEGDSAPAPAAGRPRRHAEGLLDGERSLRPALALIVDLIASGVRHPAISWPSSAVFVGVVRPAALVRRQADQAPPGQVPDEFANAIDVIVRGVKSGLPLQRMPDDHRARKRRAAGRRVHRARRAAARRRTAWRGASSA